MARRPDYPVSPHSDLGDPDCRGCIVPKYHGSEADLICNECGQFFKTVPAADVAKQLAGLVPVVEFCSATCPHCGWHSVFPNFSSMMTYVCRHCGKGVAIREAAQ